MINKISKSTSIIELGNITIVLLKNKVNAIIDHSRKIIEIEITHKSNLEYIELVNKNSEYKIIKVEDIKKTFDKITMI